MDTVTQESARESNQVVPTDVTTWLRLQGWTARGALDDVAELWQQDSRSVVVPLLRNAPDFEIRWSEMLSKLSEAVGSDPGGVILAITRSGSDVAEFRAIGEIDDSLPLTDASTLIDSVRRAMQASANAALQPRGYFGHSIPDAARDHARNVRMGQTRRGSYVVPVISRVPFLQPEDEEDAVLFEDVSYQPFARTAMLRLATGLAAIRELTHGTTAPTRSNMTEAVGAGVSSELCDSVASTLESDSISDLEVGFTWAERLPTRSDVSGLRLEAGSAPLLREMSSFLKGDPIVGRQTLVGYVKRLDRGEDDEIGRITLRALDNDKARNVSMDLSDPRYHVAGEANTDRRMVSVTGVLHREPGRTLRFTEVSDFRLLEELPSLLD